MSRPRKTIAPADHFARRVAGMRASTIREILKVTARPDVISFGGGLPAPELFPLDAIAAAFAAVMRRDGPAALQYSVTEGLPQLRAWVAARLSARDAIACVPDDVLILNGSQQALDLVAKIYLDPGDFVVLENPSYLGAIQAFDAYEARFLTVQSDGDGMIPASLEEVLAAAPARPKLLYLVPNFANPTGRTLAAGRREAIVRICEKHDLPILEDNPYGDLAFTAQRLPALASFASNAPVLHCGTGSKIVAPGLRVAWIVVREPEIRERLVPAKQSADLHSSTVAQLAFTEFVTQGAALDEHVARICEAYKLRRDAMHAALLASMPEYVRYEVPQGGMFFWVAIDRAVDTGELFALAARESVIFVPGRPFYANRDRWNELRLNFSNATPETIAVGIERLGRAIRDF